MSIFHRVETSSAPPQNETFTNNGHTLSREVHRALNYQVRPQIVAEPVTPRPEALPIAPHPTRIHVVESSIEKPNDKDHPENEDTTFSLEQYGVFAVLDGVSGGGGKIASHTARDAFGDSIQEQLHQRLPSSTTEAGNLLIKAAEDANEAVSKKPNAGETTLAAGMILTESDGQRTLVAMSIGDSRIYVLDKNGNIRFVTLDHSVIAEYRKRVITEKAEIDEKESIRFNPELSHKEKLTRQKKFSNAKTLDDLETEEDKEMFAHRGEILQSIGDKSLKLGTPYVIPLAEGDIVFACTDGVSDNLTDDDIAQIHQLYRHDSSLAFRNIVKSAEQVAYKGILNIDGTDIPMDFRQKPDDITAQIITPLEEPIPISRGAVRLSPPVSDVEVRTDEDKKEKIRTKLKNAGAKKAKDAAKLAAIPLQKVWKPADINTPDQTLESITDVFNDLKDRFNEKPVHKNRFTNGALPIIGSISAGIIGRKLGFLKDAPIPFSSTITAFAAATREVVRGTLLQEDAYKAHTRVSKDHGGKIKGWAKWNSWLEKTASNQILEIDKSRKEAKKLLTHTDTATITKDEAKKRIKYTLQHAVTNHMLNADQADRHPNEEESHFSEDDFQRSQTEMITAMQSLAEQVFPEDERQEFFTQLRKDAILHEWNARKKQGAAFTAAAVLKTAVFSYAFTTVNVARFAESVFQDGKDIIEHKIPDVVGAVGGKLHEGFGWIGNHIHGANHQPTHITTPSEGLPATVKMSSPDLIMKGNASSITGAAQGLTYQHDIQLDLQGHTSDVDGGKGYLDSLVQEHHLTLKQENNLWDAKNHVIKAQDFRYHAFVAQDKLYGDYLVKHMTGYTVFNNSVQEIVNSAHMLNEPSSIHGDWITHSAQGMKYMSPWMKNGDYISSIARGTYMTSFASEITTAINTLPIADRSHMQSILEKAHFTTDQIVHWEYLTLSEAQKLKDYLHLSSTSKT